MITVDRRQLSRAISLAATVVERRNMIPILGGVKLSANGSLALEGTDLDTFTRVELPYEGEAGEFYLSDPQAVKSAIGAAGGATVTLEATDEGKRLRVRAGSLDARLTTLPTHEFPAGQRIAERIFCSTLTAAVLAQIARVVPAISTEETRYYLNGINVSLVGDWTYRFAATDGHRLMMVDVPLPDAEGALPDSFILPRRFINIALASFAKADGPISWRVGYWGGTNHPAPTLEGQQASLPRVTLGAQVGDLRLELGSKLIDGTYPDYRRVIPGQLDHSMRCDRAALVQAVQALQPLAREKTRAVKMTFGDEGLTLQLTSPDMGEGRFAVPAEHSMPAAASIGMNAAYLLAILAQLHGEEVEMATPGAGIGNSPLVITDPADTAFKAVLMPMRV